MKNVGVTAFCFFFKIQLHLLTSIYP